ncbi:MAG: fibronectin type III domain-containing protein [Treponema sp.]|jgi:fibronectin type 3 domain-containing protein|nr:fibronectin type III domain-containing protein [Treponema sp.]
MGKIIAGFCGRRRFLNTRRAFAVLAVLALFAGCPNAAGPDNPDPDPSLETTLIQFDNSQGAFSVSVYTSPDRQANSKVADLDAYKKSKAIAWIPQSSGASFYFSYTLSIKNVQLFFVPPGDKGVVTPRIDEGKTTTIPLPSLEQVVAGNDEPLCSEAYVAIKNRGSYAFRLQRGNTVIERNDYPASLVNAGETGLYKLSAGAVSIYNLLVNATTYPLPGAALAEGRLYTMVYSGSGVALEEDTAITVTNIIANQGTGALPVPTGLKAESAPDGNGARVSWNPVAGAFYYEVYRSSSLSGIYSSISGNGLTATSYTDWDLAVDITNYYKVCAYSENYAKSSYLSEAVFIIPSAPSAPSGVQAAASSLDGSITVSWLALSIVSSYKLYRSTDFGATYAELDANASSPYRDSGLSAGTYYYKVSAANAIGESPRSAAAAATLSPPSTPGGVQAAASSLDGSITVSWSKLSTASSYKLYRSTDFGATYAELDANASSPYRDSGLSAGTYYYKVSAVNAIGESPRSAAVSAAFSAPSMPVGVRARIAVNGNVIVTWDAVSNASSYKMFRSLNASSGFNEKAAGIAETTYTDTDLLEGTTYYYKVSALNISGESSQSALASITYAMPEAPVSVGASLSGTTVSVTWSAVSNASSYKVYRSDSSIGAYTKIGAPVSPPFTDNPPAAGEWSYKVSAVNYLGESAQSSSTGEATLAVPAPDSVFATASSLNGSITVSWSAVSMANSYKIYRSIGGSYSGADWPLQSDGRRKSPAIGHNDTTITRYAFTSDGESALIINLYASSESGGDYAFVGYLDTPASPYSYYERISGSAVTPKVISINVLSAGTHYIEIGYGKNAYYTAGQDCAWFEISDGGDYQHRGEASSVSYTDSDLSAGTYYYKVSAVNALGESAQSVAAATTLSAPPAPSGVSASASSLNGSITVSWNNVSNASSYNVYRSTNSDNTYTKLVANTSSPYRDSGLSAGTYCYKVSAENALGEGLQSAAATATLSMPPAPSGLAIMIDSDTGATLSWNAVSDAVSYTVYYATAHGPFIPVPDITANTAALSSLLANTTYYFTVSSVNILGEGPQSSSVEARTASSVGSLASVWTNDSLVDWKEIKMYAFPVSSGTHYSILWQDSATTIVGGTAAISVSARYQASGISISLRTGATFQASETGVVLVTVTGKNAYSAGTYRIAVQD